jgi:hypothetical protein
MAAQPPRDLSIGLTRTHPHPDLDPLLDREPEPRISPPTLTAHHRISPRAMNCPR